MKPARLQRGINWPGQSHWIQHGDTKRTMSSADPNCKMCAENASPVQTTEHWGIVPARYPYVPKHLLLIPNRHVDLFEKLNVKEYSQLVNMLKANLKPGVIAFQNNARQGGATQDHVHVHFLEEPSKNTGVKENHWPGWRWRDPLSLPIITYAARNELIAFTHEKQRGEEPAIILKFKNWKEVGLSQTRINETLKGLRQAYEELKRGNPIAIPQGYPNRYKQTIEGLLEESKSWGFGYNMGFVKNRDGSIDVHILPRAVNAIPQERVDKEKRTLGFSGFEYLTNAGMTRQKKTATEEERWRRQQTQFGKEFVAK